MKISDVPACAFARRAATPIPTKVVPDWDALHQTLLEQGFVVIESDVIRTTSRGADECVLVKAFNSHLRTTKKLKLYTKRITKTRWFCTL
jgi:hypothetical protein